MTARIQQLRGGVLLSPTAGHQTLALPQSAAQPEVRDGEPGLGPVQHDVLQLEVPVDHTPGVDVAEARDDLAEEVPGLLLPQPQVGGEVVQQAAAREELHHEELIVPGGLNLKEASDVGVTQPPHHLGLSLQVLQEVLLVLQLLQVDDLQRHLGLEDGVEGELHLGGGPLPQSERHQLVVPHLDQLLLLLPLAAGEGDVV